MVLASIPLAIIGFKKGNKILAALSLLLITASYGIAEVAKKKRERGNEITAASLDGKEIYQATCIACHGADGKAGLSGATDLSISAMDTEGVLSVIQKGKGTMAKVEMSDEQAAAVAAYVTTTIKKK
jgi:mono/diheme cytochrome c family protein